MDDDTCHGCGQPADGHTDHNGDPACTDCTSTWNAQDDNAEWRHYAYH
ncbi:hypothetical protein P3T35_003144 [Kitasatospora sp. GP30]|nr:hypothetical protein [Kitasatospora sp. GP30]MDH6141131.1 hypothetical protein [Kitasatospora sp. GP30]